MADHVNLPLTGSGDSTATVATEDIGGVHYQFVKLISAADGSTAAATLYSSGVDANLTSAGSTKLIGLVEGVPYSSGAIARTTLNSSAEGQLIAANASRKAAAITNMATGVTLFVGLSTAAVTTAGANAHLIVAPLATFTFGGQVGQLPNYTGPIRARINSTTVAGPVVGVEFT